MVTMSRRIARSVTSWILLMHVQKSEMIVLHLLKLSHTKDTQRYLKKSYICGRGKSKQTVCDLV